MCHLSLYSPFLINITSNHMSVFSDGSSRLTYTQRKPIRSSIFVEFKNNNLHGDFHEILLSNLRL